MHISGYKVAFVHAPVLGTKQPAEAGELSVMAEGAFHPS